ncbi:hypothetical protein F7731_02290 [Cytobacillus depressus]|uniref:Lipoprotein n=1 Tax=Cytobacillus depressus TaxID=1602942 RepID=A0A6L3V9Q2_9BACI|nr:hypothetical protein [Cytobacillus depressus]KAB2338411.1 hypothetical protein F7731_02290 [Cytobacillus depressus]
MKGIFRLSLLFTMIIGLIACSSKEVVKEEDVLNLVKDYKTEQYNIKDPSNSPTGVEIGEKVKKYFLEKEFEKQMANRVFQIAPDIAKKTNKSIELNDVILEKGKENEDGTIDYNYTLKLKFYDDHSNDVIEKKGQLTIEGLKITRDWEERTTKIGNEVF